MHCLVEKGACKMVDALHPIAQIVELQNDRTQRSVSARGTAGSQHKAKERQDSHVHIRKQVIQYVAVVMQLRDIATHNCHVNINFFNLILKTAKCGYT